MQQKSKQYIRSDQMMLQPPCLVFFITLWFSLELACKASITTPEGNFFPLPTNVKILLYPGLIHVTWDCNITKSMAEHTYRIKYDGGKEENLNISKCFHEYFVSDDLEYVIHKGLEINISSSNESKIEKTIPEGKNNTAAENLRFEVYNVSIVNCSWTVGREAPKDTQYTLAFRETLNKSQQNRLYVQCEDYRTDSFGRQVGCILKAPKISFNMSIYVQLVGSSNETSIQLFDDIITLNNFVILDPPRNIRMNFSSSELEITWETPETYNSGNNCFQYNVKINGDIKDFTSRLQSYKTSNLNLKEKVNVSVRARWEDYCSKNMNWSRWSDPHIKEPESPNFTPNHLLLVLGIITFAVLLLLIFLCHRFQVWKRLFPQIPEPAKKIFESIEQKEILFQEPIITKKSLPEEDEECICLQITEIPKNEQPQYVNVNVNTGIHQAYSNIY